MVYFGGHGPQYATGLSPTLTRESPVLDPALKTHLREMLYSSVRENSGLLAARSSLSPYGTDFFPHGVFSPIEVSDCFTPLPKDLYTWRGQEYRGESNVCSVSPENLATWYLRDCLRTFPTVGSRSHLIAPCAPYTFYHVVIECRCFHCSGPELGPWNWHSSWQGMSLMQDPSHIVQEHQHTGPPSIPHMLPDLWQTRPGG